VAGGGRVSQIRFKTGMLLCFRCACYLLLDRCAVLAIGRDNFVISVWYVGRSCAFCCNLAGVQHCRGILSMGGSICG
jgi:hypothetical protein